MMRGDDHAPCGGGGRDHLDRDGACRFMGRTSPTSVTLKISVPHSVLASAASSFAMRHRRGSRTRLPSRTTSLNSTRLSSPSSSCLSSLSASRIASVYVLASRPTDTRLCAIALAASSTPASASYPDAWPYRSRPSMAGSGEALKAMASMAECTGSIASPAHAASRWAALRREVRCGAWRATMRATDSAAPLAPNACSATRTPTRQSSPDGVRPPPKPRRSMTGRGAGAFGPTSAPSSQRESAGMARAKRAPKGFLRGDAGGIRNRRPCGDSGHPDPRSHRHRFKGVDNHFTVQHARRELGPHRGDSGDDRGCRRSRDAERRPLLVRRDCAGPEPVYCEGGFLQFARSAPCRDGVPVSRPGWFTLRGPGGADIGTMHAIPALLSRYSADSNAASTVPWPASNARRAGRPIRTTPGGGAPRAPVPGPFSRCMCATVTRRMSVTKAEFCSRRRPSCTAQPVGDAGHGVQALAAG